MSEVVTLSQNTFFKSLSYRAISEFLEVIPRKKLNKSFCSQHFKIKFDIPLTFPDLIWHFDIVNEANVV